MKDFRIAIIGCGTIGGGTARVLLEMKEEFSYKFDREIETIHFDPDSRLLGTFEKSYSR